MAENLNFGIKEVIAADCCIGCGACVAQDASKATVAMTTDGLYRAQVSGADNSSLDRVCPFSDAAPNENVIAGALYGHLPSSSSEIGYYSSLYAGRVTSDDFRMGSSSGGLVSWLACRLIETGEVDGIIHVKSSDSSDGPLFEFGVSTTVQEILANRKSVYYPVEFSNAIESARDFGGKFAFVGIPCHIKALRLLQKQDSWAEKAITHTVGLVCGHMKGAGFGESLAWQVGVPPVNLLAVDFRVKDPNAPANRYRFAAYGRGDSDWSERPNSDLVGTNWGHAFFQPNACNYCDDIFAECADVCLGDAWLPRFESDSLGNNVVVVRSSVFETLLADGARQGQVQLTDLSEGEVVETQAGNVRHRRIGLSVRLADDERSETRHPTKRVSATYGTVSQNRIDLVRLRRESSAVSFGAYRAAREQATLRAFYKGVSPIVRQYDLASARTVPKKLVAYLPVRFQGRIRRMAWKGRMAIGSIVKYR